MAGGQPLDWGMDPARRPSCELPQGRKAARVSMLWRVRGVPSYQGAEGGPVNVSQEGGQGGADSARQELDQLRERMAALKEQAAAEVDEKWSSPIRTKDLFDIKVKQRLQNYDEYQTLQTRLREAEANFAADSDATGG